MEKEKGKPPVIEIREREVVKLEPKCVKCNQTEFAYKLGQLKYITYGALAYGITITIINIISKDLVKNDFKAFIMKAWSFLKTIFMSANKGFLTLSNKVDNNILHRIIHIGLWVVVAGLTIFGIYKLVEEMQYKTWRFWNIGAIGMVLLDLILIVFLSEPIKNFTKINLFIFALLFYAAYIILRIIVYMIRAKS